MPGPSEMSSGDLHRWARGVLRSTWPEASSASLLAVQSVAAHEGLYGWANALGELRGANNWGNITCPCLGEGPTCRKHGPQCYVVYQTPERGARALIDYLLKKESTREALESGSLSALISAMKKTGYFTAPLDVYQDRAAAVSRDISRAVGETSMPDWHAEKARMNQRTLVAYGERLTNDWRATDRLAERYWYSKVAAGEREPYSIAEFRADFLAYTAYYESSIKDRWIMVTTQAEFEEMVRWHRRLQQWQDRFGSDVLGTDYIRTEIPGGSEWSDEGGGWFKPLAIAIGAGIIVSVATRRT
jgi:hypothetical protein